MERIRKLAWTALAWLWVAAPILGYIEGIPTRLGVIWISQTISWAVLALALFSAEPLRHRGFGLLAWAAVLLSAIHLRANSPSYVWLTQVLLWLAAAAILARQRTFLAMRAAVVFCAFAQFIVGLWQVQGIPLPWPVTVYGPMWGTVGSVTPAAIVMALGVLWSRGLLRWTLAIGVLLSGSGTAIGFVVVYLLFPWLWLLGAVGLMFGGTLLVGIGATFRESFLLRWEFWKDVSFSLFGCGFAPFPSGWADDTQLGRLLMWRDYHNTFVDFIARFGLPGAVILAAAFAALWRVSKTGEQRWTLAFAVWVGCWQSVEQFPVLVVLILAWWVGLTGGRNALDSIRAVELPERALPACGYRQERAPVPVGRKRGWLDFCPES